MLPTVPAMHHWLVTVQLGPFNHPVLQLPAPLHLLLGVASVDNVKSCIRWICSMSIIAVLVRSLWTQQHPEAARARMLQYLMELETRQSQLWIRMEERILAALQHVRCRRSRSTSHGGDGRQDIVPQELASEHQRLSHMRGELAQTHQADHMQGLAGMRILHGLPGSSQGLDAAQHATRAGPHQRDRAREDTIGMYHEALNEDLGLNLCQGKQPSSRSAEPPATAQQPGSEYVGEANKQGHGPEHTDLRRSERLSGCQSVTQGSDTRTASQSRPGQAGLCNWHTPRPPGAASGSRNANVQKERVRTKRGVDQGLRARETKKKKLR